MARFRRKKRARNPFLRLRWKLYQTPSKLSGPLARTSKVDRAWSEMARLQVHSVPVLLNAAGQLIRRSAIGPQPDSTILVSAHRRSERWRFPPVIVLCTEDRLRVE